MIRQFVTDLILFLVVVNAWRHVSDGVRAVLSYGSTGRKLRRGPVDLSLIGRLAAEWFE